MSVWSKSIGGLMAASIVVAAVAGCGGNSGHIPSNPSNNVVPVEGGVQSLTGTSNTTVAATDSPQIIEVTLADHSVVQAVVPAGIAINAGDSVAIVPDNFTLLNGLTGGASRDPGDIKINGHLSGARIVNGHLHPAVALPAGTYTLDAEGPFAVRNGSAQLTIGEFLFHFSSNGHRLSLPIGLTGAIPSNGSDNWTNSIIASFASPYDTGNATLKITHLNGTLLRTVNLVNGTATFTDFSEDQQSHIPSQGVSVVEFTHF